MAHKCDIDADDTLYTQIAFFHLVWHVLAHPSTDAITQYYTLYN